MAARKTTTKRASSAAKKSAGAAAKAPARAAENDHPRRSGLVQRIGQLGMHLPGEAVQPLRPVERDAGDVLGLVENEGVVGHRGSFQ